VPRPRSGAVTLLVGTRKGAFTLRSDSERKRWEVRSCEFLGHVVHHLVLDPRDRKTLLLAARTWEQGATIFRSEDKGKSWKSAAKPPAFGPAGEGRYQRRVNHVFWLTPGHASEPGVWYAGTCPQGLFKSRDGGKTWKGVAGFNEADPIDEWTAAGRDATPDGPKLHSILVDPRDKAHLYVALSGGGVFESTTEGRTWTPLNEGSLADYMQETSPPFGQDPHLMAMAPTNPDRLWQQGHCGVYRMDREEGHWVRVGTNLPEEVGDVGFPIVVHPRDPDSAWVFPMDGTATWSRTPPDARPAVFRTRDAGESWERQDGGFPKENAWWTVKRTCMAQDARDPVGVYLGTSSGEIWCSVKEGRAWRCIARHLPHVYSVEVAGVTR